MADEKKKSPRGADALYDKPSEKAREKEAVATAESDMEKGDKPRGDGGEKASAADEKKVSAVGKASDKFLDALKALHKAHETERRDFHGNTRESLRQMAARHEKGFRDLVDGMGNEDEAAATEMAAAPAAEEAAEA